MEVGGFLSKIKIKVQIKNSTTNNKYEVDAILQDEIVKYKEEDNTKVIFNYKENKLIRENSELKMIYDFNNNTGVITVKELERDLKVDINTKKIKKKENDIEIVFEIEEEFKYRIEEIK